MPLSLVQYWDAFYTDDAPYFPQGIETDPESIVVESSGWREPSPDYLEINGIQVIQERYLERLIRSRSAITPDHCDNYAYASLLEKSDTRITIHVTGYGTNCPTASDVKIYSQWDVLTADPRSN